MHARSNIAAGLEKTSNNLPLHSWIDVQPINQKNYYTDFLKREDQALVTRLQNDESRNKLAKAARDKDRALAHGQNGDVDMDGDDTIMDDDDEETDSDQNGSKTIVIHPGSQNLRIGLASEVLPKTIPFCIARRSDHNESERLEPRPKRRKVDDDSEGGTEQIYGEEVSTQGTLAQAITNAPSQFASLYKTMASELKDRMRRKGKRIVPNCREVAISFNRKSSAEIISEMNDTTHVEWTEVPAKDPPAYYTSLEALRVPDESTPRYCLYWPLKYGSFNEEDYTNKDQILRDFTLIIEEAIKNQVGIKQRRDWPQYECVFVVPDLYDRSYVTTVLDLLLREFGFRRVCFIQESLAGSFGAGTYSCVIVDVGAQKTSISCVDEGMCVENSRINLRFGGADITETWMRMMLLDQFPYAEINLNKRCDFFIAEELKHKACMMSVTDVAIQQHESYLRQFGQNTRHYVFKAYDEVILAPMACFRPELLETVDTKVKNRHAFVARCYDIYDSTPNDPISQAQNDMLSRSHIVGQPPPAIDHAADRVRLQEAQAFAAKIAEDLADPSVPGSKKDDDSTPKPALNGAAGSPEHEDAHTPQPKPRDGSPAPDTSDVVAPKPRDEKDDALHAIELEADRRDRTIPIMPLHNAIALSVEHAAAGDERKMRDFFGGIIAVGGGCQFPGFNQFLEEELALLVPGFNKEIQVVAPPREIDPQLLVWKGASIFGKLRGTNDSWIGQLEYDRLGSRVLAYKAIWGY